MPDDRDLRAWRPGRSATGPPSTEQEIAAMPLGPAVAVAVTSCVPAVDAVSAGADRLTAGVTLSTLIDLVAVLGAPAALAAA